MRTPTNPTTGSQTHRRLNVPLALLLTAALGGATATGSALLGPSAAAASTTSTSTSTAEGALEFVEAANQVCRTATKAAAAVTLPHHDHDVPAYLAQLRQIAAGVQEDLRALPLPAADSELLLSRFLEPTADAHARAPQAQRQAAEASTSQELADARLQLDALRAQAQAASSFALNYGLTDCASPHSD